MKAMVLEQIQPVENKSTEGEVSPKSGPLKLINLPVPQPGKKQIRIKVTACGICHTELDEIEGRLRPKLPIILGHQIVGKVECPGPGTSKFKLDDRVGIAWINSACGKCDLCRQGYENLCANFRGTGCDVNGGYAEYAVVSEDFAYPIPDRFSDAAAAPLLCAGAIGYRALRLTGLRDGNILGLFGFGASAHIVIQIVKHKYPHSKVFVFTKPGSPRGEAAGQKKHPALICLPTQTSTSFEPDSNKCWATSLGADWVGTTGETPPAKIHCAIDFTPAWSPVVAALKVLENGGRIVINAIRKEDKDKESLLEMDYSTHLWLEKEIKSVANITRRDVEEFLPLAAEIPIIPEVQEFELEEANEALTLLKQGKIHGAGVLKISD